MRPEQAREEARRILSERRFHGTSLPRPLHGLFSWLARHLHFVARAWEWLAGKVGGVGVLWVIVGAVVLSFAVWFVSRLAQRRTEREESEVGRRAGGRGEDPAALERLADEAEQRGDLETALRLRFRAGLLRLGRAKALPLQPSLRTREARRLLRNVRFDRLARDFDEVVYGRRPPRTADVAAARSEWPQLLAEVRR
ncbi:MAG: hypothetical protein ACJ75G_03080 [Gaiellaceae bacterium]